MVRTDGVVDANTPRPPPEELRSWAVMDDRTALTSHATTSTAPPAERVHPSALASHSLKPPPRQWLLHSDIMAVALATTVLLVGTWVQMGGLADLLAGGGASWSAIARLTGLLASVLGLAGLVLVARPRPLERRYGLDRLFGVHRLLGEAMAVFVVAHVVTALVAAAAVGGLGPAIVDYSGGIAWMAAATVGAALVSIVTVTSFRSVRRHMAYETWWTLHLTAYLGMALAFVHTITLGTDLTNSLIRAIWIALHLGVVLMLLIGRWFPLARSIARPLRLVGSRPIGEDATELTMSGPRLAHMTGDAGQFVVLRALTESSWWRANPLSLSAAPAVDALRVTVRNRGDSTALLTRLRIGSRIAVEGPFGIITPDVFSQRRAVLVAGGIGVSPIKALLERLGPDSAPVVILRAHTADQAYHLAEIEELTTRCGGRVVTILGHTKLLRSGDPFAPEALTHVVGADLPDRAAVVCGPESLMAAARRGLRDAGMPEEHIHTEQPWW